MILKLSPEQEQQVRELIPTCCNWEDGNCGASTGITSIGLRRRNPASTPLICVDGKGPTPKKPQRKE